jgi:hypothetical protein
MQSTEKLNHKTFIRDSDSVKSKLVIKGDKLITTEPADIYVPLRFEVADLLTIAVDVKVIGLFPIVIDNKYSLCNVNSMITITPSYFRKVEFDGDKYYQFHFEKNSILFGNINLIQSDAVIFSLFNELISKGNVPWYIEYEDYGNIFKTAKEYANSNIATNPELTQLLVAMQSRSRTNRSIYYHTSIKDYNYLKSNPPEFIPLKSVVFSATTTINKLAGSYFKDGVVSALANPTERVERLESILKA